MYKMATAAEQVALHKLGLKSTKDMMESGNGGAILGKQREEGMH
jgi:hypothetical protein